MANREVAQIRIREDSREDGAVIVERAECERRGTDADGEDPIARRGRRRRARRAFERPVDDLLHQVAAVRVAHRLVAPGVEVRGRTGCDLGFGGVRVDGENVDRPARPDPHAPATVPDRAGAVIRPKRPILRTVNGLIAPEPTEGREVPAREREVRRRAAIGRLALALRTDARVVVAVRPLLNDRGFRRAVARRRGHRVATRGAVRPPAHAIRFVEVPDPAPPRVLRPIRCSYGGRTASNLMYSRYMRFYRNRNLVWARVTLPPR